MKVKPICYLCASKQIYDVSNLLYKIEDDKFNFILKVNKKLLEIFRKDAVPTQIGTKLHRYIKLISKNEDPFKPLKNKSNEISKKFYEILKEKLDQISSFEEKVKKAIFYAIIGNTIDFAAYNTSMDVSKFLEKDLNQKLRIDDRDKFLKDLKNAKKVIYFLDNAGEIFFDKLLIELLSQKVKVYVVVKKKPILNDATYEDAKLASLDKIKNVFLLDNGGDIIGIDLKALPEKTKKAWEESDFIVSKGMGNFESLSEYNLNKPIYYLLKAKCLPVAKELNVNKEDLICKRV